MRILPPDIFSNRARLADWLELLTLASMAGEVSTSEIRSYFRRTYDDRLSATELDGEADDLGEPEVTDLAADNLEERLSEELEYRTKAIGAAYPFQISNPSPLGSAITLQRKETWNATCTGELFYSFCLLVSGMRDHLIEVPNTPNKLVTQISKIFQICACVAVGGYTHGEVVSFGFPRATGDAFLPALQNAWARYGSYTVRSNILHGFDDQLKDGGVDIISWRPFADGCAGTILMLAQVASGSNWKDKPVANDVKGIKTWFVDGSFEHFVPAICIPFPIWSDLGEPATDVIGNSVPFDDGIRRRYMVRERTFGVIFDRGRIALSSARALNCTGATSRNYVDGIDKVNDVAVWVKEVMTHLSERRKEEGSR